MKTSNKKAAMEMSVGTIVTIVLLMSVLVLGLILTKNIFGSATDALSKVDTQLKSEINKLFSEENKAVVIMPSDGNVELRKGNKKPAGFAFSIKNNLETEETFVYKIFYIQDSCGLGEAGAQRLFEFRKYPTGSVTLGSGNNNADAPYEVYFVVPSDSPLCSVEYMLTVEKLDGSAYFSGEQLFLRIK